MLEFGKIYNADCLEGMRSLPDKCVDLVVTDPPYEAKGAGGGGAFGREHRDYYASIDDLMVGISDAALAQMLRLCRKPNMYVFCSKNQLPQMLNFAVSNKLSFDVLTWHKTNPTPACSNKYLSDTEYIVFMRKGAPLYGTYETKRKYFITQTNVADKRLWGHPTIKPIPIIKTLIENSTRDNAIILDPFMGSGTTAVATILAGGGRQFIGFEIDSDYYLKACERINATQKELNEKLF